MYDVWVRGDRVMYNVASDIKCKKYDVWMQGLGSVWNVKCKKHNVYMDAGSAMYNF